MKKKSLLFSFISVIIVVAVILSLIFVPKLKSKNNNDKNPPVEDISNSNENYATYFAVNLPNTINLYINSIAVLKYNYINIAPANMIENIEIIITKDNIATDKILLVNNVLSATEVGDYKIKFSVASSATTSFSKTISIKVHDDINQAHISQKQNSLYVGDELKFENLFELNSNSTVTVQTDNKLDYINNKFSAKQIGDSAISFTFTEGNVEYLYKFNFKIKEIPYYTITLENITNNTIQIQKGKSLLIYYNVSNRAEEKISQEINVTSLNSNIVLIESADEPLIKIKALEAGETNIVITYVIEPTITLEVKVIVI